MGSHRRPRELRMMSQSVPTGRYIAWLTLITFIGLLPHRAAVAKVVQTAHRAPDAPSGLRITPMAAAGARFSRLNPGLPGFPGYVAGQAVTTVTSPDGKTLLILTSGYNTL